MKKSFLINYRFGKDIGDDRKAPIGKSPFHDLFEETFRATDYLSGSSGISLDPSNGALSFTRKGAQIHGEARAWQFAANNAPFSKKHGGYYKHQGQKYFFNSNNTLIGKIVNAKKDIGKIGSILFEPQLFQSDKNEFGNRYEFTQEKLTYD